MRRRRLLLAAGALTLLAVVTGLIVSPWPPRPRRHNITREAYGHIKEGMTLAQVEHILGGPSGDYTEGRFAALNPLFVLPQTSMREPPPEYERKIWVGEEGYLAVALNETGVVASKWFGPVSRQPTFWDHLRRLLPWSRAEED